MLSTSSEPNPGDAPKRKLNARLVFLLLQASENLLAPRHYQQFLKQAGLERFAAPDFDVRVEPDAPEQELATFMGLVVQKLGIDSVRLFFRNVGTEIFQYLIRGSYTVRVQEQLANLPSEQKGLAVIQRLVTRLNQLGNEVELKTNNNAQPWIVTVRNCPYCVGIQSNVPICDITRILLLEIATYFSGLHFSVVEITCRAKGDLFCSYEVRERVA